MAWWEHPSDPDALDGGLVSDVEVSETNEGLSDVEQPVEGGIGWPCFDDDDCDTGICLGDGAADPGYCTELCATDCPDGYVCKHQPAYGVATFRCLAVPSSSAVRRSASSRARFRDAVRPAPFAPP